MMTITDTRQNSAKAVAYMMGCSIEELTEMLQIYDQYKKAKICPTCGQQIIISNCVSKENRETEVRVSDNK